MYVYNITFSCCFYFIIEGIAKRCLIGEQTFSLKNLISYDTFSKCQNKRGFSLIDHNSLIVKYPKQNPRFLSEDLRQSLKSIYSFRCSPINLLTTSGPVCIVNKGKFCLFISQTLFFHNVQRHLFLQSINSINRKISEFLIKKVIICNLE